VSLDELLHNFNSFHPRLKFTLKNGGASLNFLELTMINRDGKLIFDWFHKPTYSGRLLNFYSKRPMSQKRGIIINSVDKILLLSNPVFHQKNFLFLINNLLTNNYPLEMIFSSIKERLSVKFRQLNHGNMSQTSVITEHRLKFSHDFDWEKVEILNEEVYLSPQTPKITILSFHT